MEKGLLECEYLIIPDSIIYRNVSWKYLSGEDTFKSCTLLTALPISDPRMML